MKHHPKSSRFLTDDSQWDAKALQDFRTNTTNRYHTSYVGEFSASAKNDMVNSRLNVQLAGVTASAVFADQEKTLGKAA